MREDLELRMLRTAEHVVETKATVREAAKRFGVSKSTTHKDLGDRLKAADAGLYQDVRGVLEQNKAERHLRGGVATREKYKRVRKAANMPK